MNKLLWMNQLLEQRDHPLPILTFPAAKRLGISVRDLIKDPEKQAMTMAEVARVWPMGAVLSMMDLSVEAEAFGAPIRYFDDDIPTVIGAIVHDSVDAENLAVPTVSGHRTETYVEGIRRAKDRIPNRPLIAGVIGPFSLSGRLMDMTEIMVDCYMEPERVHRVLEKATAFITDYIHAFKAAGADGVLLAEPAAGLLSPALCEEFSSRYIRTIAEAVKDDDFAFFYHNCGNTLPLLDSLAGIGADAYHFGDAVSMKEVLARFSPSVPVMGNLSPSEVFRKGTPETVRAVTLSLLRENFHHRNWVLSSGCDIPPKAPLENVEAFFETVRAFYSHEGSWVK